LIVLKRRWARMHTDIYESLTGDVAYTISARKTGGIMMVMKDGQLSKLAFLELPQVSSLLSIGSGFGRDKFKAGSIHVRFPG
jgi:hypothetical protein